jgi:hypothetical protein
MTDLEVVHLLAAQREESKSVMRCVLRIHQGGKMMIAANPLDEKKAKVLQSG